PAAPSVSAELRSAELRSAGAQPKPITVKIAASPPDSEILLDGAKLDTNPFTGQFAKDTALHRLELRCVGRVTEARMIRLDQDLDLLIALPIDKASQVRSGSAAAAAAWAKSAVNKQRAPEPGTPSAPAAPVAPAAG